MTLRLRCPLASRYTRVEPAIQRFMQIDFEGLPVVSVRAKKGGVWRVAHPKRNRLHRLSQVSGKGASPTPWNKRFVTQVNGIRRDSRTTFESRAIVAPSRHGVVFGPVIW